MQPNKYEGTKHVNLRDDIKILISNETNHIRRANSISHSNISGLYLNAISESERNMDENLTSLLEGIHSSKIKHKTQTRAMFNIINELTD
jgi:hypothetical protein